MVFWSSKSQTNRVFNMCQIYALRWPPGTSSRPMPSCRVTPPSLYMSIKLWCPPLYTYHCGGMPPSLYTYMLIRLWSHAPFTVHTLFAETCPICCTLTCQSGCGAISLHCTHITVEACPLCCTPTCQSSCGVMPPSLYTHHCGGMHPLLYTYMSI